MAMTIFEWWKGNVFLFFLFLRSQKPFDLNDLIWKERKYFDRWKGNILCKRKERVSRSQWLWLWRLLIAKTFRMIGFVRKGNMCQSTKEGVLCRCNKNLFNQSILSRWRECPWVPFTSWNPKQGLGWSKFFLLSPPPPPESRNNSSNTPPRQKKAYKTPKLVIQYPMTN